MKKINKFWKHLNEPHFTLLGIWGFYLWGMHTASDGLSTGRLRAAVFIIPILIFALSFLRDPNYPHNNDKDEND